MTLDELKRYEKWVGKSAKVVLNSVREVGGWEVVFPDGVPKWAHRVRNYFNREPRVLTRMETVYANALLLRINRELDEMQLARGVEFWKARREQLRREHPTVYRDRPPSWMPQLNPNPAFWDTVAEDNALYNYVYEDQSKKIWYQMDAGGAIYHFGDEPGWAAKGEAVYQSWKGQAHTPVFKLVSPDDTGGSMETIIRNDFTRVIGRIGWGSGSEIKIGRYSIEEVNVAKPVADLVERRPKYQGSYNYSETVKVGLPKHELRDVAPHEKYRFPGVYVDPPSRFASLALRFFPERDPQGNLLETQI